MSKDSIDLNGKEVNYLFDYTNASEELVPVPIYNIHVLEAAIKYAKHYDLSYEWIEKVGKESFDEFNSDNI